MQVCCALEVGALFLKILQRIAVIAILSLVTPLLNSQTSNKHLALTWDIFTKNIFISHRLLATTLRYQRKINLSVSEYGV